MLYLAELGIDSLLEAGPEADAKDPDTVIVYLGAPDPVGLPAKEYYTDEDQVRQYTDVISQVFSALGSDNNDFKIDSSLAESVVEFEKKIAAATPDEEDLNDITVSYYCGLVTEED